MFKNQFVLVVVGIALATLALFTLHQALATAQVVWAEKLPPVVTQTPLAVEAASSRCPFSEAELQSLRLEYVKGIDRWMMRSDSGFLGYDGGLMALRDCPPLGQ